VRLQAWRPSQLCCKQHIPYYASVCLHTAPSCRFEGPLQIEFAVPLSQSAALGGARCWQCHPTPRFQCMAHTVLKCCAIEQCRLPALKSLPPLALQCQCGVELLPYFWDCAAADRSCALGWPHLLSSSLPCCSPSLVSPPPARSGGGRGAADCRRALGVSQRCQPPLASSGPAALCSGAQPGIVCSTAGHCSTARHCSTVSSANVRRPNPERELCCGIPLLPRCRHTVHCVTNLHAHHPL